MALSILWENKLHLLQIVNQEMLCIQSQGIATVMRCDNSYFFCFEVDENLDIEKI